MKILMQSQIKRFHRALDILRLHIYKLSHDLAEMRSFLTRLQEKPQQALEDVSYACFRENGQYSPISAIDGTLLQVKRLQQIANIFA